jgi:hypothetical protein
MFLGFIAFLKSLFGAAQAVSQEVKQRDAENNSPAMQANAAASTDASAAKQAAADVANPNPANFEKDIS